MYRLQWSCDLKMCRGILISEGVMYRLQPEDVSLLGRCHHFYTLFVP